MPFEQQEKYLEDNELCVGLVDGPTEVTPLRDDQLTELYAVGVQAAACLEGLGYSIDPPSLQTFIDTCYTGSPFTVHRSRRSVPSVLVQDRI